MPSSLLQLQGLAAYFLDRVGQFFASANSEPPADSFLLWYCSLTSTQRFPFTL
jgi:hypothetical protein